MQKTDLLLDTVYGVTTSSGVASRPRLRSANRHQLIIPRCRLSTYGRRAFSIAGPTVWNSLPDELRDPACGSDNFSSFLRESCLVFTNVASALQVFKCYALCKSNFYLLAHWSLVNGFHSCEQPINSQC